MLVSIAWIVLSQLMLNATLGVKQTQHDHRRRGKDLLYASENLKVVSAADTS